MTLENFLTEIPDPDHKGAEELRRTMRQFTPQGLETATSYYNQKYPERGQIHQAQVVIREEEREAVKAKMQTNAELVEKMVDVALENLLELKSKAQQDGSQKLLFTIAEEDNGRVRIAHSIPFILTGEKLILLRDENNEFGQQIFSKLAEKLGAELVQSHAPIYDRENPARTSIQGDHSSCHFIALGILKDLNPQDLEQISAFENGFTPLPKSLKYSQSFRHIQNSLPESESAAAVKQDGRSAAEYAASKKYGKDQKIITGITEKFNRFKSDLAEIIAESESDLAAPDIAARILQKRRTQAKEAIIGFSDPKQTSLSLVMPDSEYATRGKLKSGELVAKPVRYKDVNGVPLGCSIATVKAQESGLKTEFQFGETALFCVDSITKTVTAAALLRMTEEPKYQDHFSSGVETKLSTILPLLKERFRDSRYIQNELELEPDFEKITLRDLVQHTSGLAETKSQALEAELQSHPKLTTEIILDAEKLPRSSEYSEFRYSNLGYELLGATLVAIHDKTHRTTREKPSQYCEVIDELVIDRVKEKISENNSAANTDLNFFTSQQMGLASDGSTQVNDRPELEIKFGQAFRAGNFSETASHRYDIACGGSYSDAESMAKIALHILHSEEKYSIFKEENTRKIFNSSNVTKPDLDNSGNQYLTYGFGYESFLQHPQYRFHGGLGYGSNSNCVVDIRENKAAVVMVAFEQNLTLPLANAILKEERKVDSISLTADLYKKSAELNQNYSTEQLVEMRCGLEESYERFREVFDGINQEIVSVARGNAPSPIPRNLSAENLVQTSRGAEVTNEL